MEKEKLEETLKLHKLHVQGKVEGIKADLRGADLRWADLHGANLYRADLRGANLRWADLRGADFHRADLHEADLRGADLHGADLRWTNFYRADLRWTKLHRADLRGAVLCGADLHGADLHGANLYSASDLRGADFSGANIRETTLLAWAQVAFSGHGEEGRMLTAIRQEADSEPYYQCGCFSGSREELEAYIEKGDTRFKGSRLKALECVNDLLEFSGTSPCDTVAR